MATWVLMMTLSFYLTYLDDLEAAVGEAFGNVTRGAGIENPETVNNHAATIATWIPELGRYATDVLRPTYGDYYGFEYSTPKNAENGRLVPCNAYR